MTEYFDINILTFTNSTFFFITLQNKETSVKSANLLARSKGVQLVGKFLGDFQRIILKVILLGKKKETHQELRVSYNTD